MRVAGRLAAEVLDMIGEHVVPGVTTEELDLPVPRLHRESRSTPFRQTCITRGTQRPICASVNHVVCHGIPGERVLKSGDIVNIDVTVIKEGFHGDTEPHVLRWQARGAGAAPHRKLLRGDVAGHPSRCAPVPTSGDIGHAIQILAESRNFSVVREYCGHGIGRIYHEDPQVLHYGEPGTGHRIAKLA